MSQKAEVTHSPVIRVTQYDRVSSWTISLFIGLVMACVVVMSIYMTSRPPRPTIAVSVELEESPGGFADGSPNETLRVDSPEPEVRDAVLAEAISDRVEMSESIDSVVEVSETATQFVQQQLDTRTKETGTVGSAKGTGKRALGFGTGTGGFPREQRWFVKFGERASLEEYTRQLQFFGIELGALLPDGRLAYLTELTRPVPAVRFVNSGADEKRLYMTWQGGERRAFDVQLFAKANVDLRGDTTIFHFYPKETENRLALLERDYRGRPAKQIRRTYFSVEPDGQGFKFAVFRQILFQ